MNRYWLGVILYTIKVQHEELCRIEGTSLIFRNSLEHYLWNTMATARCYTKSGSVEKYEPGLFSGGVNHYPHNFTTNIIGPDSNWNYTITYKGYDDANSSNYDCYCKTIYGDFRNGSGVSKTFYFKKKGKPITKYVISIINGPSYNYDDSHYIYSGDQEQGEIYIYQIINVLKW